MSAAAHQLLRELIALPSVNPAFLPGRDDLTGEQRVADFLAFTADRAGLELEWQAVFPGRSNLLIRLTPSGGKVRRRILLAPHMDTVGVDGEARFKPVVKAGRLHGRGACDTKGSIATYLAALLELAANGPRPRETEILLTALVDEENNQSGSRALVKRGLNADLAIVGEPTLCKVITAHKGDLWLRITTHGKSAHGAKPHLGKNAIHAMARVVAELETNYAATLKQRTHPLLGRGSFHAARLSGGIGLSTYADACRISFERRSLPGDTGESFAEELRAACARVTARDTRFRADVQVTFVQAANDVAVTAPIVRTLAEAVEAVDGAPAPIEGLSYWTDAALLSAGGIPSICYGPGDIRLAHSAAEYVPVAELQRATAVLAQCAINWCAGR